MIGFGPQIEGILVSNSLTVIISATQLKQQLALTPDSRTTPLLIVDVSSDESYANAHLPAAVHVDYARLNIGTRPAPGLIPSVEKLGAELERIGLSPGNTTPHVVVYDSEVGGRAARFAWTLDLLGHSNWSWLDGGLAGWVDAGGEIERSKPHATARTLTESQDSGWTLTENVRATRDHIRSVLDNASTCIVDCRSAAEFNGEDVRSARGGHIPGAVHCDWMSSMSLEGPHPVLLATDQLKHVYEQHGITSASEIIVYCQTHHRSSHTYVVLKSLGYESIRGYDGSWSDWGNAADTPIA